MRAAAATLSLVLGVALVGRPAAQPPARPMSFSNRLLLNRAAVSGETILEVMLALAPNASPETARRLARIGGRCEISSQKGEGTSVSLVVTVTEQRPAGRAVKSVDQKF